MQSVKLMLIKQLLVIFLFTGCTGNEKKESDKSVIKEDTVTAANPNEINSAEVKSAVTPEKTASGKLEGAWEIVRAVGSSVKSNVGTVYTFEGDKLQLGKGGFNNPGKTVITDSTFSFQAEGNEYKFMYDYKFDGDTLVVTVQNSNGQTFYMLKK